MATRRSKPSKAHTRKQIKLIYKDMDGYGGDAKYKKHDTTYGEITLKGIEILVRLYQKIQPISSYPVERRVFYDLGSGIGKNVIMIGSLVPGIKSKGIEVVKERHEKAMLAFNALNDKHNIEFIHKSLYDYPLKDAAWIFISNLCFTEKMNENLAKKLEKEVQQNTIVACSVELPLHSFTLLGLHTVPMTWEENSKVYVYKRY